MPCESCIERRRKMKEWIARKLGQVWTDANPPAGFQADPPARDRGKASRTARAEPAGDARPAHGVEGVAADAGSEAVTEPAVRVLRKKRVSKVRAKPGAPR